MLEWASLGKQILDRNDLNISEQERVRFERMVREAEMLGGQHAPRTTPFETTETYTNGKILKELRSQLTPTLERYGEESPTPELIDATWQDIWEKLGERIGYVFQVPRCDRTAGELKKLRRKGRDVLLMPDVLYSPNGLSALEELFPFMQSSLAKGQPTRTIVHNSHDGGCIDIEMDVAVPYRLKPWDFIPSGAHTERVRESIETKLQEKIARDHRKSMRLPTYMVGSFFSSLLNGNNFDVQDDAKDKACYLLGSRTINTEHEFAEEKILFAQFFSNGQLSVRDTWSYGGGSGLIHPRPGTRSEGFKAIDSTPHATMTS